MKYPNGIILNKKEKKDIIYGNRGMSLESDLNSTNIYYKDNNICLVYKKPVPIKVTEVDYKTKGKLIKKAFFESPSTTDYNGVYKGRYIDFEAKETNNKNIFPLRNIHKHQILHIKDVIDNNGICFIIVRFNYYNETYLLFGKDFLDFIDNYSRNSIPIEYFKEKGYLIEERYNPRIDYIKIIKSMEGSL